MTQPTASSTQQPPGSPALVGREQEEVLLREHLTSALSGRRKLVLIGGEAGIGKTSIVASVARSALTSGAFVLSGGCYDLTAMPPFGPWLEVAAGHRPEAGGPSLAEALVVSDDMALAGGQGIRFEGVREAIAAMASAQPLLIVLEDLHWADPASLELLRFLARRLESAPLLLIGTYRSDELTRGHPLYQLLPNLVRETSAIRIDLRPLDREAVRRLIAAACPLPASDTDRLLDYLQSHAEGNPFYIHELLRSLAEQGVLKPEGYVWQLGDLVHTHVPHLLRQVVDGRVARLGEEAREGLSIAAVIGHEAPLSVWKSVAGWEDEQLLSVIERAVDARLLLAVGDGEKVAFTHALVREALYESVVSPRRRIWHRQIAEALMDLPGADPDTVAYHFTQAGDARAVEWLVRAGERAQRAFALGTALERFEAVAAMLEADPSRAGERGWLLYRIGRLLRPVDATKALRFLEEAKRIAAEVDDPLMDAYAQVDGGMMRGFLGDLRRGLAEMEAGVAALDALPVEHTAASRGMTAWVADSLPAAPRSATIALPSGVNPRRGALTLWLMNAGRIVDARSMAETYLDQIAGSTRFDDLELGSIGDAHFTLGWAHAMLGQPDNAREHFARAHMAHRATGHYFIVAMETGMELAFVALPFLTTDLAERQRLKGEVEASWHASRHPSTDRRISGSSWTCCCSREIGWKSGIWASQPASTGSGGRYSWPVSVRWPGIMGMPI